MKPDKKSEEASAEAECRFFEGPLEADQAESRQGEKGRDEFRIDMDGVEEDGRGEAVQCPELECSFFLSPFLQGKEEYLESEESTENAHAEAHDEG